MDAVDWPVTAANAVVAALLLRAAPSKLVTPGPSAAAVGELRPGGRPVPAVVVRAFAAVELIAALCAAIPVSRLAAQILVAALGTVFAALGVLGLVRGSREPCGCFGEDDGHPLGVVNILLGGVFVASAALGLSIRHLHDPATSAALSALTAVIAATLWSLIARREQLAVVIGNVRSYRSEKA